MFNFGDRSTGNEVPIASAISRARDNQARSRGCHSLTPERIFRIMILHWKYHVFKNTLFSSGNDKRSGPRRGAHSGNGLHFGFLRSRDILRQTRSDGINHRMLYKKRESDQGDPHHCFGSNAPPDTSEIKVYCPFEVRIVP